MSAYHNSENNDANLMNGTMSYDKLREKARDDQAENIDDILKNMENYSTTQTDYRFDLIANPLKLVPEAEQRTFDTFPRNAHRSEKQDSERYRSHRHDSEKSESSHDNRSNSSEHRRSSHRDNIQDQTMDDLMKNKNTPSHYPTPKAAADGPSYGSGQNIPSQVTTKYEGFLNEEELLLGKLKMLRQLGELATQHKVKLSQNYSMASSYKSMKYEFELHKDIRDKYNGTKWLGNLLCNLCYGIELGNDYFDPFSFELDGWSTQMEEDKAEYYDVLAEIYEKYFKSGRPVPPEIKLGFMIVSSAGKFHMQKKMMPDTPPLEETMINNPELREKLRQQSQAEKNRVREQNERQKTVQENALNKQHDSAISKINDLNNLKKQEQDYMNRMKVQEVAQMHELQQIQEQRQIFQKQIEIQDEQIMQNKISQRQLLTKQKQLEELQKQLNQQRSDCRSSYTEQSTNKYDNQHSGQKTMKQPFIPASLKNKFNKPPLTVTSKTKPNYPEYNNASNMAMGSGAVVTPDYKKYNDNVSVDQDIDNIITKEFESSCDSDSRSKSSAKRSRGRPRKNATNNSVGIRINT